MGVGKHDQVGFKTLAGMDRHEPDRVDGVAAPFARTFALVKRIKTAQPGQKARQARISAGVHVEREAQHGAKIRIGHLALRGRNRCRIAGKGIGLRQGSIQKIMHRQTGRSIDPPRQTQHQRDRIERRDADDAVVAILQAKVGIGTEVRSDVCASLVARVDVT